MKKKLFAFALIACAVSFTACKPNGGGGGDDPTDPTSKVTITVNPKEVVLNANEPSIRLAAKITPEDAAAVITWTSSDTTVATVTSRGYVEAQGIGKCYIYACYKDAKDSCSVRVATYMESLIFNGAIVWDEDTTYALDPATGEYIVDTIESSAGDTYYAYKALAHLRVFSDGFYVDNTGHIAGTSVGTILDLYAPMYYATAYLNKADRGTVFCLGKWQVVDNPAYMKTCAPGAINEAGYMAEMKKFIDAYNNEDSSYPQYLQSAAEFISDPTLTIWEYDASDPETAGYYHSYIPDAICTGADLHLNGNFPASQYMCGMDYSSVTFKEFDGTWGLEIEKDATTGEIKLLDEQVHCLDPGTCVYGEKPAESKGLRALNVPVISENPALKASLEKQIKERGVKVLRLKH